MAKSSAKSKKALKERTKLEQVLLTILILLILFLLLAASFNWWPFAEPYGGKNLGTAFYTASPSAEKVSTDTNGNSSSNGSSNNSGSNGTNGSNGSNGSNGTTTTSPPATTSSSVFNFSAGVNTGTTKETISAQSNGLNEHCALLVNSSTAGKQEVCTYTEGDKVVTVTYLNDRVISASRSGF